MSPEEIADEQLAAYNARDLERFVDCFVEEVPVHSFPSGEEMTDRSGPAFRERFRELFEASPNMRAELVSRATKGQVVIDQERMTGFMGSDEVRHAVAIYEMGEEKIEKVWFVA